MKYAIISLLLLAACARAHKSDVFDDFDSAGDLTAADADEFAEFDDNGQPPEGSDAKTNTANQNSARSVATNGDVLEELNSVDQEISNVAEPIELMDQRVKYKKYVGEKALNRKSFYTVQVGAYPTKQSAKIQASKLGIKLSEVSYQRADVNGKTWHRVLVGKFRYKSAALQMQKKIPVESIVRSISGEEAGFWH